MYFLWTKFRSISFDMDIYPPFHFQHKVGRRAFRLHHPRYSTCTLKRRNGSDILRNLNSNVKANETTVCIFQGSLHVNKRIIDKINDNIECRLVFLYSKEPRYMHNNNVHILKSLYAPICF